MWQWCSCADSEDSSPLFDAPVKKYNAAAVVEQHPAAVRLVPAAVDADVKPEMQPEAEPEVVQAPTAVPGPGPKPELQERQPALDWQTADGATHREWVPLVSLLDLIDFFFTQRSKFMPAALRR